MDECSSSIGHRSSSLLIGEQRRRSYVPDEHAGVNVSWSIRKLLSRRPSEKYRTLERREPRRLRKKSLSERT
ncbi:uncharacterized protein TRUGW13939_05593 [Talaromyces rugulosus]|jgi:hypothetical protein|uniref:Uncharacterized protein n=1 Tax=Talaromyces rugulosus TaxID=121627 RepID=A0A7H8QWN6_TALRU|nr:uncharacterized protein TRUGW13939_05593 [Talaromyces rugulosus]QKX58469.1 hypothetical protein TRUGW13939_05593 [Talaromyces rugulosus]